ncbi:MAG: agmatinase [Ignavibacteriales bacterium]|nr:agmatinase [Ignavibacteriales bacterium]
MKTLGIKQNFLGIEKEFSAFEKSKIAILLCPYEATVSYGGGTKFGPKAILEASHYVEFYDEELDRELYKEIGISTLAPINFGSKKNESALNMIYKNAKDVISENKFLLTIGGEHTISQALIKAHIEKFPNLSVLQFDAHSDLRIEYQGNKYSHASVMARVCEFLSPKKLFQVGIRAQCIEEPVFIKKNGVNTYYAHQIRNWSKKKTWQDEIVGKLSEEVYISFDVDGFDPSIMPATGTTEPNGLMWQEVMDLLWLVGKKKKIVGADVVEFSPIKNLNYPNETAAKLVYKILNSAFL